MAYSEKVIDHYENPRNVGSFEKGDDSVGTGMVGAPACGDVMKLQIRVNDAGVIEDAKFKTYGCGSAIASSSLVTEWVKGKTLDQALEVSNQNIADYCENTIGVKFPMFSKTSVTGNQAVPLFKQLAELTGTRPRWNFYKYVIARDGTHAVAFSSMTGPQDKSFVAEVEKQLSVKLP